jgi:hypothetical protein
VDRERAAGGHNVPGGADTYAQCICSTVVHGERNGSLSGPRKSQNLPISAQHPRGHPRHVSNAPRSRVSDVQTHQRLARAFRQPDPRP